MATSTSTPATTPIDFADIPLPDLPPMPADWDFDEPVLKRTKTDAPAPNQTYLAKRIARRAQLKKSKDPTESETDEDNDPDYDGVTPDPKVPPASTKKKKRKAPSPAAARRQQKKVFRNLKERIAKDKAKFDFMDSSNLSTDSEDEAYEANKLKRKARIKKERDPDAPPSQHRWQKHLRAFRVSNAEDCAGKSCAVISQLARVSYQPRPKCPTCNK